MFKCKWTRAFDGHFNIGCANKTKQRGYSHFKPDDLHEGTKWDFAYCPYCGRKIKLTK